MPDKKLEKLKQILEMVDNQLDPEELKKIFAVMTQMKQGIESDTQALKEAIATVSSTMQSRLETTLSDSDKRMNESATKQITESMNPMMAAHEEMMAECDAKMEDMEGMMEEHHKEIIEEVKGMLPVVPELKPETGVGVRDKLEALSGDERLDVKAIKGLDEHLRKVTDRIVVGGVGAIPTVGYSILAASGTVDGTNLTFTFAGKPAMVNVNGAFYQEGHGWTYTASNVVLDNPVGTGGHIFGLR